MTTVLVGIAAMALASPGAKAAEAYVCEGGRVVYVQARDIERLKRTDRCIAAYYGLQVEAEATEHVAGAQAADPPAAALGHARPPVVHVNTRETPREPQRTAKRAGATAASGTVGRIVEPAAPKPLPVAHPDTDFRTVRILNAAPGATAVYHHQR